MKLYKLYLSMNKSYNNTFTMCKKVEDNNYNDLFVITTLESTSLMFQTHVLPMNYS